jgi:hypothetical protein
VSGAQPNAPIASWRPGHYVWPGGRTRIVLFGGIGSRTGDPERSFAGLIRYLADHGNYDPRRDVLEGTFAGAESNGAWRPRPYIPSDTRRSLLDIAEAAAGTLEWYRDRLPGNSRLLVVGYSLGGVAALDGATLAIVRDRAGWRDRIAGVVTLAAPVRGCNAGALVHWAWLATAEPDPLGEAGRDLDARWRDPDEQTRLTRRAAFVRAAGAPVLTLADPDDAVVRPEEALLPAPNQSDAELLVKVRARHPGTLGHGALLDEPTVWQRILSLIGPQLSDGSPDAPDPIETELEALKRRMRAEGRLK